ncbi:MAG: trypsin-like serine protease, partial [Actinomycetes bacterium]
MRGEELSPDLARVEADLLETGLRTTALPDSHPEQVIELRELVAVAIRILRGQEPGSGLIAPPMRQHQLENPIVDTRLGLAGDAGHFPSAEDGIQRVHASDPIGRLHEIVKILAGPVELHEQWRDHKQGLDAGAHAPAPDVVEREGLTRQARQIAAGAGVVLAIALAAVVVSGGWVADPTVVAAIGFGPVFGLRSAGRRLKAIGAATAVAVAVLLSSATPASAIEGGREVDSAPWAAAVFTDKGFMGTGVLISPDHVLTAGHVVDLESGLEVVVGNVDHRLGVSIKVAEYYSLPKTD